MLGFGVRVSEGDGGWMFVVKTMKICFSLVYASNNNPQHIYKIFSSQVFASYLIIIVVTYAFIGQKRRIVCQTGMEEASLICRTIAFLQNILEIQL